MALLSMYYGIGMTLWWAIKEGVPTHDWQRRRRRHRRPSG